MASEDDEKRGDDERDDDDARDEKRDDDDKQSDDDEQRDDDKRDDGEKDDKPRARTSDDYGPDDDDGDGKPKRRWLKIGGPILAVIVIAAIVGVVLSSQSTPMKKKPANPKGPISGAATSRQLLNGINQSGATLGDAKAKLTLTEWSDLQCPECADFELNVLPVLIRRYVRDGKVKLVFRQMPTLTGSVRATQAALAAGRQNKLWSYADLWLRNQGKAESGYATPTFVNKVGDAVPGLDPTAFRRAAVTPAAAAIRRDFAAARAAGVSAPPGFTLQEGGTTHVLRWTQMVPVEFTGPIDALLNTK